MIHKVILHYRAPYPTNHGRPLRRSVIRTDQGLEDARRRAREWADLRFAHIARVEIFQGRQRIETIK